MNSRVLLAALAGAVVNFLMGWLIFGTLFMSLYKNSSTAESVATMRPEPLIWSYFLGSFVWAFLLAWLFQRWAGISTLRSGLIAGAVIGFLALLASSFNWYAGMNMWTSLPAILIDPLGNLLVSGLTGGVVGWVLGYKSGK